MKLLKLAPLPPHCEFGWDVPQLLVPGLRNAGDYEEESGNASRCRKPDHAVGKERPLHHREEEVGEEGGGGCKGDREPGEEAAQLGGEKLGGVEQRHLNRICHRTTGRL